VKAARRDTLAGLAFVSPWLIGFLAFMAAPIVMSFYYSFTDYPLLEPPIWIGLGNYARMFTDPVFWKTMENTTVYALFAIPIGTTLALLVAWLLNQNVRGQSVFRAAVFLPSLVPLVAATMIWLWLFNGELGIINQAWDVVGPVVAPVVNLLVPGLAGASVFALTCLPVIVLVARFRDGQNKGWGLFGLAQIIFLSVAVWLLLSGRLGWITSAGIPVHGPNWLGEATWIMPALVIMSLWAVGQAVVIYLAALQDVPIALYEAADLDGMGPLTRFLNVTVPMISPVILFNVIMAIIASWQVFAVPYIMLGSSGGPDRAGYFYTMYLYDNAFRYQQMGYASAMAWVQLLIILALTGLTFLLSRKLVHYRAG